MKRILMIEDDKGLIRVVGDYLKSNGYQFEALADAIRGTQIVLKENFDLLLLDLMLPGISGFDILRELRSRGAIMPIIILSAKFQLADKVSGLRLGADDYLVKPFEFEELAARIESALRREEFRKIEHENQNGEWLDFNVPDMKFGANILSFRSCELKHEGKVVPLSNIEFRLLAYMLLNEGRILSLDEILQQVWHYEEAVSSRTLYVHVGWIRKKIEVLDSLQSHIKNIRGVGYMFTKNPT